MLNNQEVKQIHFGSGSPPYLSDQQMAQLLNQLDAHFNLAKENQQYAIKIDPPSLGENSLDVFNTLGFNRIKGTIQIINYSQAI